MRLPTVLAVVTAVAAGTARRARADEAADAALRSEVVALQRHVVEAAVALGDERPDVALVELDAAADAAAAGQVSAGPALRRSLVAAGRRIRRARTAVDALSADDDATRAAARIRDAAVPAQGALRRLGLRGADGCAVFATGAGSSCVQRAGAVARFRVLARGVAPALTIENDAGAQALEPVPEALGSGRWRVRWGTDVGGGRVVARGAVTADVRAACVGAPGALAVRSPRAATYGGGTRYARVGTAFAAVAPTVDGAGPFSFSVDPALPAGLALDAATGAIAGTPTSSGPASSHVVTVRNVRGAASAVVVLDVDPALPPEVADLAGGFAVETVVAAADVPVKMAWAPDGRLFYDELLTGQVRVVGADGTLAAAPYATVPVLTGGERGLLGLALAPDFASSGHVYVYASTAAGDGRPERNRVLRFTGTGAAGAGPEVVVDDLPIGLTQNAGHLGFGPDGCLYVATGDTGDAALAQDDASLAGRVLRFAADGSVPADNPVPGSPEWARGFRNPFAFAFRPETGGLFATENGPTAHDELDYVLPGRNFEWGAAPDASFGALRGVRIVDWTPVIVPTGLAFHTGAGFGPEHAGALFLASYDLEEVLRLELSGVDLLAETPFLRFAPDGIAHKPLDVLVAPDGSLHVSTFTAIWRVRRD